MNRLNQKTNLWRPAGAWLPLAFLLWAQVSFGLDYPAAGDVSRGGQVWAENCARCHNMRSPTDLRDDQWVTSVFHMRVRAGLTGQETRDILSFLQASNTQVSAKAVSAGLGSADVSSSGQSGKLIYQKNCIACHGKDGKGPLPGVPDFTKPGPILNKSDEQLLTNIINGFQSAGNPMPMPARGGNSQLTDEELAATLKYIREFHPR